MNSIQPTPLLNRLPHYKKYVQDPAQISLKLFKESAAANAQKLAQKIHSTPFDRAASTLDLPIHRETFQVGPFTASVASCQGRRRTMEDAHIATLLRLPTLQKEIPLFGVFDGHGGSKASAFLVQNLPRYLIHYLEKFNPATPAGIWNALKHAFVELDHDYPNLDGSTATIALVIDGQLWIANLGDTRAILANGTQLTEDANPSAPRYLKSIEKRGGRVFLDRINGNLAVGRAFGDHRIATPSGHCAVPHAPKITRHPLASTLLIACDGVWDVATTTQAARQITANPDPAALIAKAYNAGSADNLTALVVQLSPLAINPQSTTLESLRGDSSAVRAADS